MLAPIWSKHSTLFFHVQNCATAPLGYPTAWGVGKVNAVINNVRFVRSRVQFFYNSCVKHGVGKVYSVGVFVSLRLK